MVALIELAASVGSICCSNYLGDLAVILLVIIELSETFTSLLFTQTPHIIEAVVCITIGIIMIWLFKQLLQFQGSDFACSPQTCGTIWCGGV